MLVFCADYGIAGDDGYDLMAAIDNRFAVDWKDFDLGIHFSSEGFGPPWPIGLANSCEMYVVQPITIADLADAVRTGQWKGTPAIPLSRSRRRLIYVMSWGCWGMLIALTGAAAIFAILRWVRN